MGYEKNSQEIKHFYNDTNQAWREIFKLRQRLKQLEKLDKTQFLLNLLFFLFISGLIVSQIILYELLFFN